MVISTQYLPTKVVGYLILPAYLCTYVPPLIITYLPTSRIGRTTSKKVETDDRKLRWISI